MERAVDWLFSHPDFENDQDQADTGNQIDNETKQYFLYAMISHKGTSAHCGHYVAYIKKENGWVLFNDDKVVHVPDIKPASEVAYLYFYKRFDQ
jgi:ubiquitin carboxyl-terminal hydrolase 5/13